VFDGSAARQDTEGKELPGLWGRTESWGENRAKVVAAVVVGEGEREGAEKGEGGAHGKGGEWVSGVSV
jgi:hypothetical protein